MEVGSSSFIAFLQCCDQSLDICLDKAIRPVKSPFWGQAETKRRQ